MMEQLGTIRKLGVSLALKMLDMIKILTWNVKALNTSDKQKEVCNLMMNHDPKICYLVETKIKTENKDNVAKIIWRLGGGG